MNIRMLGFMPLIAVGMTCSAQTIQVNKDNKTIAITATDSAEAEADTAVISIGFISYGAEQDATYAAASRTSNQIVKALLDSGLQRKQIRSEDQEPTRIEEQERNYVDKGMRFVFKQGWNVTVKAADAANVLHQAITAGANNSGGIQWKLADESALEAAASDKALMHAKRFAETMALGLHSKLGALLYASNTEPARNRFGTSYETVEVNADTKKSNLVPLAVIPDKVTRSATVYAAFSIE